ncbi:MAG: hypothetical protein GXO75_15785 [Calditrichaeota bacterium]|nr:hypothetical protein [Calditrichota bacterium]
MIKFKKALSLLVMFALLILKISFAQETWRESTFRDFIDGTFDDAGANMYVSHNGRIQTVNRWDVNGDGNIDILCANSHPLIEKCWTCPFIGATARITA